MIKSALYPCVLLLWVSVCTSIAAGVVPIQWSSAGMRCETGVLVLERAYYGTPPPGVCDANCRTGSEAKGGNCFFINNTHCAQEVTRAEVNVVYGTCRPLPAPSSCDIALSGLDASLSVSFSCLPGGKIFDPHNLTTAWKSNDITFVRGYSSNVTADVTTQCTVKSDSPTPHSTLKVTMLKLPPASSDMNNSSDNLTLDDIIFRLRDDTWRVEESVYPRWRSVFEKEFVMVFVVRVASDRSRPFWVSLHNADGLIEITCAPVRKVATTTAAMETTEVTSSSVTPYKEITSEVPTTQTPDTSFTWTDMLIVALGTAVGVLCLVLCLVLIVYCVRREKRRTRRARMPSVEYHGRGEDSFVVTSLGRDTDDRFLIPPTRHCYDNQERPLPPGSSVENGCYGLFVDMTNSGSGKTDAIGSDHTKGREAKTPAVKGSEAMTAAMKGLESCDAGDMGGDYLTPAPIQNTKGMHSDYLTPAPAGKHTAMQSDYLTRDPVRKPAEAPEYTALTTPGAIGVTRTGDVIHPSEFPDEKSAARVVSDRCTEDEEESVYMEIMDSDVNSKC